MKLSLISRVTKSATAFAMVLGTSSVFVAFSAEPAFAQSSSNSSGRGSSGRGGTRILTSQDDSSTSTGGGAESRRNVKASHATSQAAASSSENDMNTYRDTQLALAAAKEAQDAALEEYIRLSGLGEDAKAAEFADGGYDAALAAATLAFARTQESATVAEETVAQSLLQMTGGRTLSDEELASLHNILGL